MAFPTYRPRKDIKVLDHQDAPSPWVTETRSEPSPVLAEIPQIINTELSDAQLARTIAKSTRTGVLSLHYGGQKPPMSLNLPVFVADNGTPYCSVPTPWLQIGAIKDMAGVSLTLAETPLTASESTLHRGVTYRGTLRVMTKDQNNYSTRLREFALAQPKVGGQIEVSQSRLCTIAVEQVAIADALGIYQIDRDDYDAAETDPLVDIAPTLTNFVVGEYGESLAMLCNAFGEVSKAVNARLVSIDHLGIDLVATLMDGSDEPVRVGFSKPVFNSEEVRGEFGVLIRAASFKQA